MILKLILSLCLTLTFAGQRQVSSLPLIESAEDISLRLMENDPIVLEAIKIIADLGLDNDKKESESESTPQNSQDKIQGRGLFDIFSANAPPPPGQYNHGPAPANHPGQLGLQLFGGQKYLMKDKKNAWSNPGTSLLTSKQERTGMSAGQNFAQGFKHGSSAIFDSSAAAGDIIASAFGKGKNRVSGDASVVDPLTNAVVHGAGVLGGSIIDAVADLTGTQKDLKDLAYLAGAGAGGTAGWYGHAWWLKGSHDAIKTVAVLLNAEKLVGMQGQSRFQDDNRPGAKNQLNLQNILSR